MLKIILIFFSGSLFFSFIHLSSCKQSEKSSVPKEVKTPAKTIDQSSSGNASNKAKITATIITIEDTRDSSDIQSPCFKAPCMANILIEKIERKGSLFHTSESNEITAFFIYTLHATNEDLFPNLGKWYPGLKINDKFEAVIESRMAPGNNFNYIIYEYKKIE